MSVSITHAYALVPWEAEPTFVAVPCDPGQHWIRMIDRSRIKRPTPTFAREMATYATTEVPIVELERREYQSPDLGWRDFVYATREDHGGRLLDILRAGEAAVLFLGSLRRWLA